MGLVPRPVDSVPTFMEQILQKRRVCVYIQYVRIEMVKTLIFSARPGPWFIFPAQPVIKIFILGPFRPAKGHKYSLTRSATRTTRGEANKYFKV